MLLSLLVLQLPLPVLLSCLGCLKGRLGDLLLGCFGCLGSLGLFARQTLSRLPTSPCCLLPLFPGFLLCFEKLLLSLLLSPFLGKCFCPLVGLDQHLLLRLPLSFRPLLLGFSES